MPHSDVEFWNSMYAEDPTESEVMDVFIADAVADTPPATAIDFGCSAGTNALMLARRNWRVLGIDCVKSAIDYANHEAEKHGLDATFKVADINSLTVPGDIITEKVDLVISCYSMPSKSSDRQKFLKLAQDCLNPGGRLIITEWDRSMTSKWSNIKASELTSLDEITEHLDKLKIDIAELRIFKTPDNIDIKHDFSEGANVIFVSATAE